MINYMYTTATSPLVVLVALQGMSSCAVHSLALQHKPWEKDSDRNQKSETLLIGNLVSRICLTLTSSASCLKLTHFEADGIGAGEDGSSKMHGLWSDVWIPSSWLGNAIRSVAVALGDSGQTNKNHWHIARQLRQLGIQAMMQELSIFQYLSAEAMRTSALVLYLLKHHQGPLDILRQESESGMVYWITASRALPVNCMWRLSKDNNRQGIGWHWWWCRLDRRRWLIMLHCLLFTALPLKSKIESLPEDEALCLGVVGGSFGLGFGEPGGLHSPQALVCACGKCSVPSCDFPKYLRPWFLLEEVEGVEYLHARGKRFEVRVAEYLLLRSFGVNLQALGPDINHPTKPGVDPATGKEVKACAVALGPWSFQIVAEKAATWMATWRKKATLVPSRFRLHLCTQVWHSTCTYLYSTCTLLTSTYTTCRYCTCVLCNMTRHDASRRLGVELPWNEKDSNRLASMAVCHVLLWSVFITVPGFHRPYFKCTGIVSSRHSELSFFSVTDIFIFYTSQCAHHCRACDAAYCTLFYACSCISL